MMLCCIKGNRSAMPLSRVALTSPAGAARGQVCLAYAWRTLISPLRCMNETVLTLAVKFVRLMTFRMKQMNFLESEITFSMSCLRKQVSLLRRSVHPTMKYMEINEFVTSVVVWISWLYICLTNQLQRKKKTSLKKIISFSL